MRMLLLQDATGVLPDKPTIAALGPFAAALILAAAVYLGLPVLWNRKGLAAKPA